MCIIIQVGVILVRYKSCCTYQRVHGLRSHVCSMASHPCPTLALLMFYTVQAALMYRTDDDPVTKLPNACLFLRAFVLDWAHVGDGVTWYV